MRGFRMSVPAVRRIVVGVDGSAESAAALRWACREASLRGAEVHAVHVREANCHSLASYAAAASPSAGKDAADDDIEEMWRAALPDQGSAVRVRTEVVEGLAPRVLLDRCDGADMLVLGTASDVPGSSRSAGPVIRACLRRASCPVVVISAAQQQIPRREPPVRPADAHIAVPAAVGGPVHAGV
jgi:nucleotide-binding universal stress UspA family protein